jgi:multisubunit Na+/H+ antiporter MnhE subunit
LGAILGICVSEVIRKIVIVMFPTLQVSMTFRDLLGGMVLGLVESIAPAALGIDFQLKDVIAFTLLILILLFRPTGILGTATQEEKL